MNWIQLALATRSSCGAAGLFVRGWASVVNRHLNMFTLIALGVGAAYVYGVIATLAPEMFPDSFRIMGEVAVYSSPQPSLWSSCCSVRCWSCVRAVEQAARFEIC